MPFYPSPPMGGYRTQTYFARTFVRSHDLPQRSHQPSALGIHLPAIMDRVLQGYLPSLLRERRRGVAEQTVKPREPSHPSPLSSEWCRFPRRRRTEGLRDLSQRHLRSGHTLFLAVRPRPRRDGRRYELRFRILRM